MARHRKKSAFSLFSFQDIIMSAVGVVILILLVLLLQLVSQLLSATEPTITEDELRQQIASLQSIQEELRDSITEIERFRDESEIFTPSQEKIDAIQSTIDELETDIALTEKTIEEVKERIDTLRNDPARRQLTETQNETNQLRDEIAGLRPRSGGTGVQMNIVAPRDTDKRAFLVDYGRNITVIPTDGSPRQTFDTAARFNSWLSGRDPQREHYVVYVRPSRFREHDRSARMNPIITNLQDRGFSVGFQVIGENTYFTLND